MVEWEANGPEGQSWLPREDILDPDLLSEFHNLNTDRPVPGVVLTFVRYLLERIVEEGVL